MVNTAQRPTLSENVVRVGTCDDTSLLAELGAVTFRESFPNTSHEDLEISKKISRAKISLPI